jgi:FMN-dependent NADH-azoreductase
MRLLHIIATPRGHESNTIRVSNAFIEELYLRDPGLHVRVLDLFKADLPAVAGANIENKYKLITGQELNETQKSSWEAIEDNIKRFLDADIYIISTPMWNFGIPYALKYYIDAIVQPGYLFRYNEHGVPEGLVQGKKMLVVSSRGGDYSPNTYLHSLDFVEPYLRTIFNFVGITDIQFVNAQPVDVSPEVRRSAMLKAIGEARSLAASDWLLNEPGPQVLFPEGVKPQPLADPVETLET